MLCLEEYRIFNNKPYKPTISSPKPISKGWNLLAQAGFEFAERHIKVIWTLGPETQS